MSFLGSIDMPRYMARVELRLARVEYVETAPGTLEHALATLRYGRAIREVEKHIRQPLPALLRRQAE